MPKKFKPKKTNRNLQLGLTVLALVMMVIIAGQILHFVKILTNPLGLVSLDQKKYVWDGKSNTNIVIQTNSTSLVSLNPLEQKATIISIPDEIYLDVSDGFDNWLLGSVYDLGESSKKGLGYHLVKKSLSSLMGIPIDGYIRFEGEMKNINPNELIEFVRQSPFSGIGIVSKIKSDLTPLELIRLKFGLLKVRFDKINYIDLSRLEILDTQNLPDGSNALTLDPIKLDSVMTDFVDPKIREENIPIAIFNTTDYPQLAQKVKRLITNIGGNVIIVSNYPQSLKQSQIMAEETNTLTFKRLKQIFPSCQKDGCDNLKTAERAQINIFLGEDFAKIW